jgi:hypothetical protein
LDSPTRAQQAGFVILLTIVGLFAVVRFLQD